METQFQTNGKHVIVDVWNADPLKLNDLLGLCGNMEEGIEKAGATIIDHIKHQFEPQGVTILFLLSESHYSIHTYPEKRYASVDCYTCGIPQPAVAISHLLNFLKPESDQVAVDALYVERGIDTGMVVER